jgi:NADH-quinone oxidoreductase subunit M
VLNCLIIIPLLAGLLIAILPSTFEKFFKWISVGALTGVLGICVWLTYHFDTQDPNFQFAYQADWITLSAGNLGLISIDYLLGLDGFSMPMVLLAGIVLWVGAVASFEISTRQRAYHALYLLLAANVLGCFMALDFFLFFLFFEFMLLPMYFLIGLWGGPNRQYASLKFFLYTLLGSLFILLVIIGLYLSVADPIETARHLRLAAEGQLSESNVIRQVQEMLAAGQIPASHVVHTFDMRWIADSRNYLPQSPLHAVSGVLLNEVPLRVWAFWLLFVGFAIKLPLVPVHTWLPDAHVEAPTPVSVVLAGILLKVGGYGFLRMVYDIFPENALQYAPWLAGLGVLAILYGAFNALAQDDLKKMIAYSSVSHMGFVLLGIASLRPEGISGAIFQLFSHGILSSMLFLVAGVLYHRTHDRQISHYRGLASVMPQYTWLTALAFFASLGLPGFSGFVGEFFSLMGAFNSPLFSRWFAVLAALGLILGAAYFLWSFQRVFLGTFWTKSSDVRLPDLTPREQILLLLLALMTLYWGIFPQSILKLSEKTIEVFLGQFS